MKKTPTDTTTGNHNGNTGHKDKILEVTILTLQIQTLAEDRHVFAIESNVTRTAWKSMFDRNADLQQPAQEYITRLCEMIGFHEPIVSDSDLEVLLDHGLAYVEVEVQLMKERGLRKHNPEWAKITPAHARHALRNNPKFRVRTWMLATDQRHSRAKRSRSYAV